MVENLEIARRMHRISDRGAVDRVIQKLDLWVDERLTPFGTFFQSMGVLP
ncbi:hypothetical protein POTG_01839 [Paenibacillus sp. oral taxon 786 str. D14]|nr:hypothetical protein POTG_01839 [Paenibacillus sp. oral taxon 786 str. D14]